MARALWCRGKGGVILALHNSLPTYLAACSLLSLRQTGRGPSCYACLCKRSSCFWLYMCAMFPSLAGMEARFPTPPPQCGWCLFENWALHLLFVTTEGILILLWTYCSFSLSSDGQFKLLRQCMRHGSRDMLQARAGCMRQCDLLSDTPLTSFLPFLFFSSHHHVTAAEQRQCDKTAALRCPALHTTHTALPILPSCLYVTWLPAYLYALHALLHDWHGLHCTPACLQNLPLPQLPTTTFQTPTHLGHSHLVCMPSSLNLPQPFASTHHATSPSNSMTWAVGKEKADRRTCGRPYLSTLLPHTCFLCGLGMTVPMLVVGIPGTSPSPICLV